MRHSSSGTAGRPEGPIARCLRHNGAVKVLLRNPRRELDVARSAAGRRPCSTGSGVNRESVLVIVDDTLVTGDTVLDDAATVEVRPVISGGAR